MWEHTHQESILSLGIQLNEISICAEKSRCSHKLQAQQVTTLSREQTRVRHFVCQGRQALHVQKPHQKA